MKKEFLYMLGLTFIVCLSSDVYSMEVGQVTGKVETGPAAYFWNAKVESVFCDFIKKYLAMNQETGRNSEINPEKSANQIDFYERFSIKQGKHIITIGDRQGKTIIDMNEGLGQFYSESLDEGDIKKKAEKLQAGESITLPLTGDAANVIFDQITKLVGEKDNSEHPARLSQVVDSLLVAVGMKYGKGREEKIIHNLSQKFDLAWFQEIFSWANDRRMNAQQVVEETLRRIIKPAPKVLLMWECGDNVDWMSSPNGERAVISYKDGKAIIIDTQDGTVIFKDDNVDHIRFSSNGKRAGIIYKDGKVKIIDTQDSRVIFEDANTYSIRLNSNGKRAGIMYKDGKIIIINPEDGTVIFPKELNPEELNIYCIRFSPNGKMTEICYEDGEVIIIDTQDGRLIFEDENVYCIRFSSNGKRAGIVYKNGKLIIIDTQDGRLISKDDNVCKIRFSPNEKRGIIYKDGKVKIIGRENSRAIFEDDKVYEMEFGPNGKRAEIRYGDDEGKIIDTENSRVIFEDDKVYEMELGSNEKRAGIVYKNGKGIIIDFEDYNRDIDFIKFSPEQLFFTFKLSQNPHYLDHVQDKNDAKRIWQSFESGLQQKLKKSYFPKVNFSSLRVWM